jgi:hypothetical protein
VTQVAVDAFGNVIGDALARSNNSSGNDSFAADSRGVGPSYVRDGTSGDSSYVIFNDTPPKNNFSLGDIAVAAAPDFGDGGPQDFDRSNDVLLTDASRYTGDKLTISQTPGERAEAQSVASGRQASDTQNRLNELQRNINDLKALQEGASLPSTSVSSASTSNARQAAHDAFVKADAQLASNLYATGAADIRTEVTHMPNRPYEPFESDYPDPTQPSTPANTAEVAGPSFEDVSNQKVISGSYNRWSEMGSALSDGRYGDAWNHLNFTASEQGKAAVNARLFPQPSPEQARIDKMAASPFGAIAWGTSRLLGGSLREQDGMLNYVGAWEQLAGAKSGTYNQMLVKGAPTPSSFASVGGRRTGPLLLPVPGAAPPAKRNIVEFQGMEVRAVRDLEHLSTGTLQAMQKYGFAAKTSMATRWCCIITNRIQQGLSSKYRPSITALEILCNTLLATPKGLV